MTTTTSRLFLVIKEDVIVQRTGYLVRAIDESEAKACVAAGMYIEETKPETMDTIESYTPTVEEIKLDGEGQQR